MLCFLHSKPQQGRNVAWNVAGSQGREIRCSLDAWGRCVSGTQGWARGTLSPDECSWPGGDRSLVELGGWSVADLGPRTTTRYWACHPIVTLSGGLLLSRLLNLHLSPLWACWGQACWCVLGMGRAPRRPDTHCTLLFSAGKLGGLAGTPQALQLRVLLNPTR